MNETIVKVANKTENYTIVSNEVPRDNTLSARAKGIYFYIMTLPANWVIHKEEIYSHFTEGRDALDTAWRELINAGYIEKDTIREAGKIVSNTWIVYESSRITEKPNQVKPVTGKPSDGKPVTDNPQLLSTNELSTDNTNNLKQKKKYGSKNNVSLTDEETERLIKDFHVLANIAIEYLSNYKVEKGYKTKDDNLTIRRWVVDAVRKQEGLPPIQKPLPPKINVPRRCKHIDSSGNQCEGEIFNSHCKTCGAIYDGSGNEIL